MANNYLFVDGGALLSDFKKIRHRLHLPTDSKLNLVAFARYFVGPEFHKFGNEYRRFTFYFVRGDDERLRANLLLPDFSKAWEVEDLRIELCGKRVTQFEHAREWLDEHDAPETVRDCLYRSEKAVDTRICCDALQLAATGKLDRLFLYTNDSDFVPLCATLRQLGANINLFRCTAENVNRELVSEFDAFCVFHSEAALRAVIVDAAGKPLPPQAVPSTSPALE